MEVISLSSKEEIDRLENDPNQIQIYDYTVKDEKTGKPSVGFRPIKEQSGKFYWQDKTIFDLDERRKPSRLIKRIIRYSEKNIIVEYIMDGTGIDLLKPVIEAARKLPDHAAMDRW